MHSKSTCIKNSSYAWNIIIILIIIILKKNNDYFFMNL